MRLQISPVIPYAVGIVLLVFGILRAKYLGAPRAPFLAETDAALPTADPAPVRGKEQHRHLRMGVVWVLLGLFLVVSTYLQTHR
jgi:hypothetical protein